MTSKIVILTTLEVLNFEFGQFQHSEFAKMPQNWATDIVKMSDFEFQNWFHRKKMSILSKLFLPSRNDSVYDILRESNFWKSKISKFAHFDNFGSSEFYFWLFFATFQGSKMH